MAGSAASRIDVFRTSREQADCDWRDRIGEVLSPVGLTVRSDSSGMHDFEAFGEIRADFAPDGTVCLKDPFVESCSACPQVALVL